VGSILTPPTLGAPRCALFLWACSSRSFDDMRRGNFLS